MGRFLSEQGGGGYLTVSWQSMTRENGDADNRIKTVTFFLFGGIQALHIVEIPTS
jgi:hypothetical protein